MLFPEIQRSRAASGFKEKQKIHIEIHAGILGTQVQTLKYHWEKKLKYVLFIAPEFIPHEPISSQPFEK